MPWVIVIFPAQPEFTHIWFFSVWDFRRHGIRSGDTGLDPARLCHFLPRVCTPAKQHWQWLPQMVSLLHAFTYIISFNHRNNSRRWVLSFYRWRKWPQEGKKWAYWHTAMADEDWWTDGLMESDGLTPKLVCSITKLSTSQGTFLRGNSDFFIHKVSLVQRCLSYLLALTFSHSQLLSCSHLDPRGAGLAHEDGVCFGTRVTTGTCPSMGNEHPFLLEQPGFRFWPLPGSTSSFWVTKNKPSNLALFSQLISN